MSFNSAEFGRQFAHTWLAAQKEGAVGGSGSGGRRGGRGGRGGGGRGGTRLRCYRCRSTEHLIADCPYRGESRREVRRRLREAPPAQEALPGHDEQPAPLPPPPYSAALVAPVAPAVAPVPAPAPAPAPAAPIEQPTVSFAVPQDEPQHPPTPPPAAEPQTGRPPERLARTLEWCPRFARWRYVHYLDGSIEWYEQR